MAKISEYPTITSLNGQELVLMDSGSPANRQTVTATTATIAQAVAQSIAAGIGVFTATQSGVVPASGGGFSSVIRSDGSWQPVFDPTTGLFGYYAQTSAEISAGVTPSNYSYVPGDVRRYGASLSAVDNSAAFTKAFLCNTSVYAPGSVGQKYNFTSGITVPGNVGLIGDGPFNPTGPACGTLLSFSNSVATCVTVNGNVSNLSTTLRGFGVTRTGGSPPANSIGILVYGGYSILLTDIWSDNHAICVSFKADHGGFLGYGIAANVYNLSTSRASDVHLQQDTWPEVRIVNSRFGTNGAFDYNCNGYIRVTGGSTTNAANGPNTLYISNCQFNQGSNAAAYWIRFESLTPASISDIGDFSFNNVHVEGISSGYLFSDSSWISLIRIKITNGHFNTILPFCVLNSATTIGDWNLSNSYLAGNFTIAPSAQMNFINLSNNHVLGAVSITGVASSTYSSTGNTVSGGVTYAGNFATLVSVGDTISGGSFTLSATGNNAGSFRFTGSSFCSGAWTPALSSGAGSGITYSRQAGWYEINGSQITLYFSIVLTALGTASGNVSMTGLPYAATSRVSGAGAGGALANTSNLTGGPFTGPMTALVLAGVTTAGLTTYTAAGAGPLTVTQLTSTSAISGTITYEWT